jgi:hypothetical protein
MMRVMMMTAALVWCLGCTGTETGNPFDEPFDAEMRADAHSSDPAAVDIQAGDISVRQVWLSVDPIELIPSSDCDATIGDSLAPPNFGTADHAEADSTLAVFDLLPNEYCRARMPLALTSGALPNGAPPELAGRSVVVTGTVTGPDIEFVIASEIDRVVELRAIDSGFEMSSDNGFLFLGFDVATWLADLDIASGTPDANGVVVIDSTNNPALLTAFEANLDGGIELYRDDDRDGSVGLDEELLARGQPE